MKHLDLFSGIGGFSLAFDTIFYEQKNEHTFVEYDPFCQEVLKKHWPDAEIHGDIRAFVADSNEQRRIHWRSEKLPAEKSYKTQRKPVASPDTSSVYVLTGGFPCQPFSQAGRRKGTDDDRYLWPPMLECVSIFRPEWVIAENVSGLTTWNNGLVLETVCTDLEREGYEVQPFVIPAVAVGAPHRRDRVWIVANRRYERSEKQSEQTKGSEQYSLNAPDAGHEHGSAGRNERMETDPAKRSSRIADAERCSKDDANPAGERLQRIGKKRTGQRRQPHRAGSYERPDWSKDWAEIATRLCRVDDGIPRRLDRNPRLKALGNAIVPAVVEVIFEKIKEIDGYNT